MVILSEAGSFVRSVGEELSVLLVSLRMFLLGVLTASSELLVLNVSHVEHLLH